MKFWIIGLICSFSILFGSQFRMQERLEKAKNGDYIVTESNKMITLLAIRNISPTSLILEEISAPSHNLKNFPTSWNEWVKAKAPGHTSWSMTEIDLKTGTVVECYSFSKSAWIQLSQKESIIATLLQLPLKPVELKNQKRIGPPPMPGETDVRKVWTPPLIREGRKIEQAKFDQFETTWPKDGSELAGENVFLYFDQENRSPFPFWVQVQTSHATAALRTIDSGSKFVSIYRSFPRRVPQFVGSPQKTENGLRLSLKSPKYFRDFELFVIDITGKEKEITPITHSLIEENGEFLSLEISQDDLKETLKQDHRYTWLLVPVGHSESYTESLKPFVWSQKSEPQ